MDEDLGVRYMKFRDQPEYQQDGSTVPTRIYSFYLGTHGPFTLKVPLATWTGNEIAPYVDTLRAHLRNLPR